MRKIPIFFFHLFPNLFNHLDLNCVPKDLGFSFFFGTFFQLYLKILLLHRRLFLCCIFLIFEGRNILLEQIFFFMNHLTISTSPSVSITTLAPHEAKLSLPPYLTTLSGIFYFKGQYVFCLPFLTLDHGSLLPCFLLGTYHMLG